MNKDHPSAAPVITLAMVDAGIQALRLSDRDVNTDEEIVRSVFSAMVTAEGDVACQAASSLQSA